MPFEKNEGMKSTSGDVYLNALLYILLDRYLPFRLKVVMQADSQHWCHTMASNQVANRARFCLHPLPVFPYDDCIELRLKSL